MLWIFLYIACTYTMHANEHQVLGQSPRSANVIEKYPKIIWWISGSFQPMTVIPKPEEAYLTPSNTNKEILASSLQGSAGLTQQWNKHVDFLFSIGTQIHAGHIYVPITIEGRLLPFRKKVNPFIQLGFGGMISREIGLFGSRGFGINAHISKNIQLEIQYKEIAGDMFVFSTDNPMQIPMRQRGVQTTLYMHL